MEVMDRRKALIKKIHTLKHILGIDDETYREILQMWNVKSSTELSDYNLYELAKYLESKSGQCKEKPYCQYKNRDIYYATDKQMRYIAGLWAEKSSIKDREKRLRALNKFIKRIAGVDSIVFLLKEDVPKVIKAIQSLKRRG